MSAVAGPVVASLGSPRGDLPIRGQPAPHSEAGAASGDTDGEARFRPAW